METEAKRFKARSPMLSPTHRGKRVHSPEAASPNQHLRDLINAKKAKRLQAEKEQGEEEMRMKARLRQQMADAEKKKAQAAEAAATENERLRKDTEAGMLKKMKEDEEHFMWLKEIEENRLKQARGMAATSADARAKQNAWAAEQVRLKKQMAAEAEQEMQRLLKQLHDEDEKARQVVEERERLREKFEDEKTMLEAKAAEEERLRKELEKEVEAEKARLQAQAAKEERLRKQLEMEVESASKQRLQA